MSVSAGAPTTPDNPAYNPVRAGVLRSPAMSLRTGKTGNMWYLIEDFFEQGLIAKLFIGVGWLAVLIMVASFVDSLLP